MTEQIIPHTIRLDGFDWPFKEVTAVASLTRSGDARGEVWHVRHHERELLLKRRVIQRWSERIGATWFGAGLAHEVKMMRAAAEAGLPVANVVAFGVRRKMGLVIESAVLIDWLANHVSLRELVKQDERGIEWCAQTYVGLLAAVRRAGFADRDFGVGNVLIPIPSPLRGEGVWVDLEAAYHAAPDNAHASIITCAAALTSWWVATQGNEHYFRQLFQLMQQQLPPPHPGWPVIIPNLNRNISKRIAKQLRHNRIRQAPPPLS